MNSTNNTSIIVKTKYTQLNKIKISIHFEDFLFYLKFHDACQNCQQRNRDVPLNMYSMGNIESYTHIQPKIF